jgi:signal transduction histidine kinase
MTDAGHIVRGDSATSWLQSIDDIVTALTHAQVHPDGTSALTTILDRIVRRLRVETLSVLLYDGAAEELTLEAAAGVRDDVTLPDESHHTGTHISGSAFSTKTITIANSLPTDARGDQRMVRIWASLTPSRTLRNGVFIPFETSQECAGVIRAFNRIDADDRPCDFLQEDVTHLAAVTALLAQVIGIVWERQRFTDITTALSEIADSDDIEQVSNRIVRLAARITNSPACTLYIIEPHDADHFRLAASCGFHRSHADLARFPVKGSISGLAARNRSTQTVYDLHTAPGVANRPVLDDERFFGALVVPLLTSLVSGCIVVFRRETRPFAESTKSALEHLTLLVGSVLQARSRTMGAAEFTDRLVKAAHSLRNPLTDINKALDRIQNLTRRPSPDPIAIKSVISSAFDELRRVNERIDSWLHIPDGAVRAMGLDRRDVALSGVISRVLARLHESARKRHIDLRVDDSIARLPTLRLDRDKMDLAFENLVENAIKYSWENQPVDIHGDFSERQVRISVIDKGLGIPPGMFEAIFDGLKRSPILDRTRYIRGTGLGLQIVRNIVTAHGGFVEVASKPFLNDPERVAAFEGYETRFTIHLPR